MKFAHRRPAFLLPLLVALVALAPAGAQGSNSRWEFFQTLDWPGRQAYLASPPATPFTEAFLRQALELTDAAQIEAGADNEVSAKRGVAIRLIRALAALPAPAAAPAIARIPLQYRDPALRGEAWLALAQLGDRSSIPAMVRSLGLLNDSGDRTRGEEIQAVYLIRALGLLKAPEGFRPVAAAAQAWYSPASRVKAQARSTLALLVPDVTAATLDLLAHDEDLSLREGVFQGVVDQNDPAVTGPAATALLGSVVRLQAADKADSDRIARLILAALGAAQKVAAPPAALVPPLQLLLAGHAGPQEKAQAIRLLGRINDPAALALLTQTLTKFNDQQKSGGNGPDDLGLVRELFQALGRTGQKDARQPLDDARFSNYTPALTREAAAALEKLPRD